jgi:hypothetical protein
MPATPPMVITDPMRPLCQPCANRNTPKKGPIPACMSAIKKFNACKGQIARDFTPEFAGTSGTSSIRHLDWVSP